MNTKKIRELLENREFVSVATCDFKGRPNVAPKFFLKMEQNYLYLIDYVFGTTFTNLKLNPRISISVMDKEAMTGYQLNGSVEIIENGEEYKKVEAELLQREIDLSAKRIIEGVVQGKAHKNFELSLPEKFVVFKFKLEEVVEIGHKGDLKREKL
jgi:predicted pyridoxine 5'-phosphate oxidase superfamily flavin-nucleotide-binding protein